MAEEYSIHEVIISDSKGNLFNYHSDYMNENFSYDKEHDQISEYKSEYKPTQIKEMLKEELELFQYYIDEGLFNYDSEKDMTLGYVETTADEVIEKIKKWDFSPLDNLIRHYTRITLLRELVGQPLNAKEEQLAKDLHNTVEVVQQLWQCIRREYTYQESKVHMKAFQEGKTTAKQLVIIDKEDV